jgi:hypothetical protein
MSNQPTGKAQAWIPTSNLRLNNGVLEQQWLTPLLATDQTVETEWRKVEEVPTPPAARSATPTPAARPATRSAPVRK